MSLSPYGAGGPKALSPSQSTPASYCPTFSVIGVGTDHDCDGVDATTAAVKAVCDAVGKLNVDPGLQHRFLQIRLEAPMSEKNHQIMCINLPSLQQALPPNISLLPIDIVFGGLHAPQGSSVTCVVVAHVSLLHQQQQMAKPASVLAITYPDRSEFAPAMPMASQQPCGEVHMTTAWAEVEQQQPPLPYQQPKPNNAQELTNSAFASMIDQDTMPTRHDR